MNKLQEMQQDVQDMKSILTKLLEAISAPSIQPIREPEYFPVDTTALQRNELDLFLDRLGFIPYGRCIESYDHPQYSTLSYSTAIQLYNVEDWEHDGVYLKPEACPALVNFKFPAPMVRAAKAGKAFEKLKLQWCKKSKKFICYSHKLEMRYPEYYDLFIAPLKKNTEAPL